MTSWEYASARSKSTLATLAAYLRPKIKAGAEMLRAGRKGVLPVAAVGCFVVGAFTVSTLAGWVVAGVGCLFVEWRFSR